MAKDYQRVITKVKSAEQVGDEGAPVWMIEFENGSTLRASEMNYKLYQEPKPGDEYTLIMNEGRFTVLKNYSPGPVRSIELIKKQKRYPGKGTLNA